MGNSKISYKENLENVQECPVVAMNNSVLGPIKISLQPWYMVRKLIFTELGLPLVPPCF